MISAKFVPLKYYTLSSQPRRLTSFSVGLFGSANSVTRSYPVMRKSCIYREFGQLAKILHFVSKLDTSLYSKSMGNSCQLSYCCVPFENEAVKPIKSIHIWKANTITIPNMDMSVSVYRVGKKYIGCNIKNTEICRFLYSRLSFVDVFGPLSTKSLVITNLMDT